MPTRALLRSTSFGSLGSTVVGLSLSAAVIGCSGPEQPQLDNPQLDMAMPVGPGDLASPGAKDLAGPPPADLAGPKFSCRGSDAPGMTYQLVTDSIKLPSSAGAAAYTFDIDGDGRAENQLKNLIGIIAAVGLDLQGGIDLAVQSGQVLELMSVTADRLDTSSCVGVLAVPAKPTAGSPKFDGTDVLAKAGTESALQGTLAAGKLGTVEPKSLTAATEPALLVKLAIAGVALDLPVRGVHIEGSVEKNGSLIKIRDGKLHGVVSAKDIDLVVLPAIATTVTDMINKDPMSSTTKTIIGLFENMMNPATKTKCMVASKCCATSPATCVILPEEVKSSVVGTIITPDVEVLDDMDRWAPVAGGKSYDAMSIGIGFTAITATYK